MGIAVTLSRDVEKRLREAKRRIPSDRHQLLEELVRTLAPLIRDGKLPKSKELHNKGLFWVRKTFGQFPEIGMRDGVAAILGAVAHRRCGRKLNDWPVIKAELLPICKKLGHFPGSTYLERQGRNDLMIAIQRHHGGVEAVAAKMGFRPSQVQYGHWDDFENIRRVLLPVFESAGRSLQTDELKHHPDKRVRAVLNFVKRHGGYPKVCDVLGFPLPGYWRTDAGFYVESRGEFCISNFFHSRGIPHKPQPVIVAGRKFRGDFSVEGQFLIEFLGWMNKPHYRRNWYKKKLPLIKANGWKLIEVYPEDIDLARGESGIEERFGELFREILCSVTPVRSRRRRSRTKYVLPPGFWGDWENFWQEISPYCDHEKKLLPTTGELRAVGRCDIAKAYRHHGDTAGVEEKSGYRAASRLPTGGFGKRGLCQYSFDDVVDEYRVACEKAGKRLKDDDLQGPGLRRIKHRIVNVGSTLVKVSTAAGYPSENLPHGFWNNRENAVELIAKLATTLGHYPTNVEFISHKMSTIANYYKKYPGGREAFVKDVMKRVRNRQIPHE